MLDAAKGDYGIAVEQIAALDPQPVIARIIAPAPIAPLRDDPDEPEKQDRQWHE